MELPVLFIIVLVGVLFGAIGLGEWGEKYIEVPVRDETDERY